MTQQVIPTTKKQKNKSKDGNKTSAVSEGGALSSRRARTIFIEHTKAIFSGVMNAEMSADALVPPDKVSSLLKLRQNQVWAECKNRSKMRSDDHSSFKRVDLADSVVSDVESGAPLLDSALRDEAGISAMPGQDNLGDTGPDDLIATLSTEAYVEHRLLPKLHHFQQEAPRLSRILTFYEVLIFVASLIGTLLGALKVKEWIPIAVAFGSIIGTLLQYQNLQGRLSAVNAGIQDLTNLSLQWCSLGVVEQRTRSVKRFVIEVCENAIVREATAFTAGAAQAVQDTQRSRSEQEKGEDNADSKQKRS